MHKRTLTWSDASLSTIGSVIGRVWGPLSQRGQRRWFRLIEEGIVLCVWSMLSMTKAAVALRQRVFMPGARIWGNIQALARGGGKKKKHSSNYPQ